MRRHRLARWRLGVAWATVVAGVSLVACQGPQPLRAGHEVELRLAPNDRVVYNVDVPRSTVVRLVVEQQGLDVMLTVDARPSVDLPFGDRVDEELWWLASAGESLDVEIASLGGEGTARLRVELQPATEELRAQVAGFWDLQRGLEHLGAARVGPAAADFDRALAKPAVDRASWRPVAMAALGRAELRSGRAAEAISTLQQVLALLGASGRESTAISEQAQAALAARVALDLGIGHSELGNHAEAQRALSKAEGQARRADDAYGVALALDQQGVLADAQGDLDQAIERLDAAVDLFSDLGAARQRTMARLHLARCQMKLGAMSAARQILDEEWARRDDLDRFLRARLFQDLGWWHRLEGEAAPARDLLLQALEIDPTSVALLDRLGTVHLDLGEVEAARAFYARAADGIGDRRHWQAHLDGNLCRLERLAGHAEKALGLCRGALDAFAASGAVGSEAAMATRSAEILSELDQLWAAEAMASRAVDLLEKQRLESTGGDRRSTFLSVRLEAYRLLIDLRMRLHADRPDEGWDRRALEIFELTRARRLRDVLAAQQVDAANELPAPAGVETLRALLDPGTAFVFVHLGHRRSVLWKLAATGLESHLLPSQEVIEAAARAWSVLLTDSLRAGSWNRRLERRRAAHLASMLFDPLGVGSATERRWVLVVDGALQRVPFAALPSPFGDERPLLSDVETVQLPSASTLAALRSLTAGRAPARELLAIVADPVYGLDDVRAAVWTNRSAAGPRDPARAPEPLPRLLDTAAEARSILGLVPQAQRLLLEGFDARLDQVLSGRLAAYRIVHFATHANTDWVAERPVGLVLSQTTPEGEILDGVLGLDALYGLHLPAELAVLSACSTGAGRDVAGEGLLSLTRGFMHAGTPRVLVSLWPVRDRATRELMERFYDGLLRRCLRPPEALRLAQRQMWRLGRPQQDWAAFQLQGEWRGFEACQTAD